MMVKKTITTNDMNTLQRKIRQDEANLLEQERRQKEAEERQVVREEIDERKFESNAEKVKRLYKIGKEASTNAVLGYETFTSMMNKMIEPLLLISELSLLSYRGEYPTMASRFANDYMFIPLSNLARQKLFPLSKKPENMTISYALEMDEHGVISQDRVKNSLSYSPAILQERLSDPANSTAKNSMGVAFFEEIKKWLSSVERDRYQLQDQGGENYKIMDTQNNNAELTPEAFLALKNHPQHGLQKYFTDNIEEECKPGPGGP